MEPHDRPCTSESAEMIALRSSHIAYFSSKAFRRLLQPMTLREGLVHNSTVRRTSIIFPSLLPLERVSADAKGTMPDVV